MSSDTVLYSLYLQNFWMNFLLLRNRGEVSTNTIPVTRAEKTVIAAKAGTSFLGLSYAHSPLSYTVAGPGRFWLIDMTKRWAVTDNPPGIIIRRYSQ